MKSQTLYLAGLVFALLFASCSTQSPAPTSAPVKPPTVAPTIAPTTTPEPTTPPPTPTAVPVPTLPPAEATITFEGKQCTYDGPQPIPANETFTVNWYVMDIDYDLYGLYASTFLADAGRLI